MLFVHDGHLLAALVQPKRPRLGVSSNCTPPSRDVPTARSLRAAGPRRARSRCCPLAAPWHKLENAWTSPSEFASALRFSRPPTEQAVCSPIFIQNARDSSVADVAVPRSDARVAGGAPSGSIRPCPLLSPLRNGSSRSGVPVHEDNGSCDHAPLVFCRINQLLENGTLAWIRSCWVSTEGSRLWNVPTEAWSLRATTVSTTT